MSDEYKLSDAERESQRGTAKFFRGLGVFFSIAAPGAGSLAKTFIFDKIAEDADRQAETGVGRKPLDIDPTPY